MEWDAATEYEKTAWEALSYAFVGYGIDYAFIAMGLVGYDPAEIERMLFEDVAPVCISNLECVVPAVMWGFDVDELVEDILRNRRAIARSRFRRYLYQRSVKRYRREYAALWAEIHRELDRQTRSRAVHGE